MFCSCLFLNFPPLPSLSLSIAFKSCMCGSMSCSSISLIKHTRSFITPGLISHRKCWGRAFGRGRPPLSHSYDHPFWAETINPVFSLCSSVSLKRIFNSLPIDCWKLNACQFEWVLQSFKKCSVCKNRAAAGVDRWPSLQQRERELKYSAGVLRIDDLGGLYVFFMCWTLFIDILLLHYLWRLIWGCHCTAGIWY